jgi:hypothetical protein
VLIARGNSPILSCVTAPKVHNLHNVHFPRQVSRVVPIALGQNLRSGAGVQLLNRETSSETRRAEGDHEARLADSREKRDLVMSKIREGFFQAKVSRLKKGSRES